MDEKASIYGGYRLRNNAYVIRFPDDEHRAENRRLVEQLGIVEELPTHPELLLLHVDPAPADAKDGWRNLHKVLGDECGVYPVILDDDGNSKYPLGSIIVRFPTPPSDDELEQWAHDHKLVVQERNEYAPQQVSFHPAKHERQFLPEVVHRLSETSGIRSWPDTLSSFRRC